MAVGDRLSFKLATQRVSETVASAPMQTSRALPVTPMIPLVRGVRRDHMAPVTAVGIAAPRISQMSLSLGGHATTSFGVTHPEVLPCSTCQKPCVFSATETLPFQMKTSPSSACAAQPLYQRRVVTQTTPHNSGRNAHGLGTEICQDVEENDGRVMGKQHDFYTVQDKGNGRYLFDLVHAVMCNGCCQSNLRQKPEMQKWNNVVGERGHVERFSAWSHLIGFFAFLLYTITRHLFFYRSSTAFAWATAAAASTSVTFLSSMIYHATSPDVRIAMLTRQLDFVAIYMSIAVCSVADLAAVTRGFVNVPVVSIVDVPIAATVLALFFAFRRYELSCEDTLMEVSNVYSNPPVQTKRNRHVLLIFAPFVIRSIVDAPLASGCLGAGITTLTTHR